MSQQGGHSEIEDYPRSQRISPRWSTVWKVVGVLVVLSPGILYLAIERKILSLALWAQPRGNSLCAAAFLYAGDHDDCLPLAQNWEPVLQSYRKVEIETEYNAWFLSKRKVRFAMNENLPGVRTSSLEEDFLMPLFFLSNLPGPSAVGGKEDVAYDEYDSARVSFTDSVTANVRKHDVQIIQWTVPDPSRYQ